MSRIVFIVLKSINKAVHAAAVAHSGHWSDLKLGIDFSPKILLNPIFRVSACQDGISEVIRKFQEAVLGVMNLVPDAYFDAFTRPIINNKFEVSSREKKRETKNYIAMYTMAHFGKLT